MIVSNSQVQNVLRVYASQTERIRRDKRLEMQDKKDILVLSKEAKELKNIQSKVKSYLEAIPDIRAEKVAELKKMITEGRYNISSNTIAEKMLGRSLIDDILRD